MVKLSMLLLLSRHRNILIAAIVLVLIISVALFIPRNDSESAITVGETTITTDESEAQQLTASTLPTASGVTPEDDDAEGDSSNSSSVCSPAHPEPSSDGKYLDVSNMSELSAAVSQVSPGDVIRLKAGTYNQTDKLLFDAVNGNKDAPIVLDTFPGDEREATLAGDGGTSIQLAESSHIQIHNIAITGTAFGIRSTGSNNLVLRNLHIFDTDWKAIELTSTGSQTGVTGSHSHDIKVECNLIHGQGNLDTPDNASNGEGIYIGSGFIPGARTHNVEVRYNEVYDTTAEAIELKPYTYNITVENNLVHDITISSSGNVGAVVAVINPGAFASVGVETDLEDPNYVITGNRIWNIKRSTQANDDNGPRPWPWATAVGIRIGSAATVTDNIIWNTEDSGIKVQDLYGKTDRYNKLEVSNNTVFNASTNPVKPAEAVQALLGVLELTAENNIADSFSSQWTGSTVKPSEVEFAGQLDGLADAGKGPGSAFETGSDGIGGPENFDSLFWQ